MQLGHYMVLKLSLLQKKNNTMIPKIIHFCWLSDDPYPELIRFCMDSWKKILPDYQIMKWDTTTFDINSVQYVKEAYERRKWAPAADYIRLYALYNHGGVYLDSDVFVKKSFDSFLNNECFSAIELTEKLYKESLSTGVIDKDGNVLDKKAVRIPGVAIQAAVIGSVKGNEYIRECMLHYESVPFVMENGIEHNSQYVLPDAMAFIAGDYGFKYIDKEQTLKSGLKFYPSVYIAGYPDLETDSTYAIHWCTGSWRTVSVIVKIKRFIKRHLFMRKKRF